MKRFILYLLTFFCVMVFATSSYSQISDCQSCSTKTMESLCSSCQSPNVCFPNYCLCAASCVSSQQADNLKDYYSRNPQGYMSYEDYTNKDQNAKANAMLKAMGGTPAPQNNNSAQANNNTTPANNNSTPANNNPTPTTVNNNTTPANNNNSGGGSADAVFLSSIAFNPPEIERNTGTPNNNSGGSTNALGIDFSQNSPDVNRAKELIGGAVPNAGDLLGGGSSNSPVNLANQSVEGGQSGGGNKGGATQPAGSSVSGKVEQSSFTGASSLNEDYGMGSCSSDNIFQQLACRAGTIGSGLKSVAYMIAGFGLIVFSFAAIFGKVKWPLFATIMFSCFLLSATVFVINMMTKSGDASWIGGIKSNGDSYSASTAPAGNIDSNEVSKTDS